MDPTRATSPAGSQGSNDTQPDLPHSMLFVPKFTKAREPRPLNRDGTPVNPELNREPSPADKPPLPRAEPAGAPAIAEVSAAADEPSTPPAPAPKPPKKGARARASWRKMTGGGDVA